MPMFDNPRRELERLHEQLLAEEEEELEELIEEYGEEDYEEFFQEDYREEYAQEPFYRNFSNRYGANVRNFANGYRGEALLEEEPEDDWDEENGEPYALFPENRRERRRRLRREKAEAKAKAKAAKKSTVGLKLLLVLETMGILAILIWWVVKLW